MGCSMSRIVTGIMHNKKILFFLLPLFITPPLCATLYVHVKAITTKYTRRNPERVFVDFDNNGIVTHNTLIPRPPVIYAPCYVPSPQPQDDQSSATLLALVGNMRIFGREQYSANQPHSSLQLSLDYGDGEPMKNLLETIQPADDTYGFNNRALGKHIRLTEHEGILVNCLRVIDFWQQPQ